MDIILYTIGIVTLIEGIYFSAFPMKTKRLLLRFFNNPKHIRKIGMIEAVIGLVFIIVGLIL